MCRSFWKLSLNQWTDLCNAHTAMFISDIWAAYKMWASFQQDCKSCQWVYKFIHKLFSAATNISEFMVLPEACQSISKLRRRHKLRIMGSTIQNLFKIQWGRLICFLLNSFNIPWHSWFIAEPFLTKEPETQNKSEPKNHWTILTVWEIKLKIYDQLKEV